MFGSHPPPRSWEQFEEFCADVFQSAWADPTLVRHGRAGQRQHGVDIVAREGSLYSIGLQCKKRSDWPVANLSIADIDADIRKATKFRPCLRRFYILTTAPDDVALQEHVRKVNQTHERGGLFEVCLLGWAEILRRATRDPAVMAKHFAPIGAQAPRSPLLATWFMSHGRLEKGGDDFALDVVELSQDLHDWPTGHFVIRQRESDELLAELGRYEDRQLSTEERRNRIALRTELRAHTDLEARAVQAVTAMLTDPDLVASLQSVFEPFDRSHLAVEAFVNDQLRPLSGHPGVGYLRLTPPGRAYHEGGISEELTVEEMRSINALMAERVAMYGKPLTDTVAELPDGVHYRKAVPRIVRCLFDLIEHNRCTWEELRRSQMLDTGMWSVSVN